MKHEVILAGWLALVIGAAALDWLVPAEPGPHDPAFCPLVAALAVEPLAAGMAWRAIAARAGCWQEKTPPERG